MENVQPNDLLTVTALTQAEFADDALLMALISVCKLFDNPLSAEALTAGLPLENNKLTPALFIRAAERAGLSAGFVKRPLTEISPLVLPAVLLLKDGKTSVLTKIEENLCTVIVPETHDGEKTIPITVLAETYAGSVFFLQRKHQFDSRVQNTIIPKTKHWFWDVVGKSWPIYAEALLASLLINLFALASPLFIMNVYDRVVPNHAIESLWVLAAGVGIVYCFELIMKALRGYFIDTAGKRSDILLSASIFEKVLNIKMSVRPVSTGVFANNLQEFEAFRDFLTSATLTAIIDLPFLILFLVIAAVIGGNLALIPLAVLPLAVITGLLVQKPLKRSILELFKFSSQKSATLFETVANLETVKTIGAEGQVQRQWESTIGNMAKLGVESRFYAATAVNMAGFLQQLASVGVVVAGVYKITAGELTTGGLIACTILTGRALAPVGQVAALLTRYHQARAAFDSLNTLMNLPVERDANRQYLNRPVFKGGIEFKNVTFSYPGQPVNALEKVSFNIKPGERVAFLGRIGSGKSTLEKLIMALYESQEGAILIDGTDIRQLDPAQLRRQIGYVPQDTALMYGSVKDNIVYGSRFADDAAVLRAADIAGVRQFTDKHPAGFDLPVGEGGTALSGGQRQSIAIARALLLGPPVYLMDEPTNAMDNSTEEGFKQRFAAHLGTRTLLLITHRASLLSLVDRLIVLDAGQIVADGPKEQVLEALKSGQIKVAT
ncbi:MAG: type I secretion system permease/ATPase [Methylobacter sp.]|nr:MAG: type I secretion system permease/ATPase [Methylobacter sp.]